MTDTISAHNHEKIIDFSSVKRTEFHFLKNPAERKFELMIIESDLEKETLEESTEKN